MRKLTKGLIAAALVAGATLGLSVPAEAATQSYTATCTGTKIGTRIQVNNFSTGYITITAYDQKGGSQRVFYGPVSGSVVRAGFLGYTRFVVSGTAFGASTYCV